MPQFVPPDFEEGINTTASPLRYYRLTQGLSVIKRNGHYVTVRTLNGDEIAPLLEGTDYFVGGHIYDVTDAVATALALDGYLTVTPPGGGGEDEGFGVGGFGEGPFGA